MATKKTPATPPATVPPPTAAAPQGKTPLVAKQPQSKQQAALSVGMFLFTDDSWSNAYWADGDLHCEERVLFG